MTGVAEKTDMRVDLAGMRLPNPLMTASGCAANGKELHRFFDIAELGAFVAPHGWPRRPAGCSTPSACKAPG